MLRKEATRFVVSAAPAAALRCYTAVLPVEIISRDDRIVAYS